MYVRKFEGETLEEALQAVKKELGPDAIVLKTITNKGLKGAFKKNRIEITAAISEKNYTKKAKVDNVLTNDQKEEFYQGSSSYLSNMIDTHDNNDQKASSIGGYGKMGLNKAVSSTKNIGEKIKSGLDDFLNVGLAGEGEELERNIKSEQHVNTTSMEDEFIMTHAKPTFIKESKAKSPSYEERAAAFDDSNNELIDEQRKKIDDLERVVFELSKNVERLDKREPTGLFELRATLRSLDVNEKYIQKIIKKAIFDLSEKDLLNADIVFEFALREMSNDVSVDMPLFSCIDSSESPVVTVLISETSCGQTSMMQKIGALKNDSILIKNIGNGETEKNRKFSEQIFDMNIVRTNGIAEIVSECRKAVEKGKSVFIDYKNSNEEINEIKKFIDGLKRSFDKVEILISLSAIHSELYNKKVVSRYGNLANGLVVSNVDLCLNFGALFNMSEEYRDLPYKFFGTGQVVPDDLEAASSERVLAGVFQLS